MSEEGRDITIQLLACPCGSNKKRTCLTIWATGHPVIELRIDKSIKVGFNLDFTVNATYFVHFVHPISILKIIFEGPNSLPRYINLELQGFSGWNEEVKLN